MPAPELELTDLAVSALSEVVDPATVGPLVDVVSHEPGVVDLKFECLLPGYTGWRWTVSTAHLEDAAPTVLEVELLPDEGALLAPPWVPWAERLAEYRRTHAVGPHGDEESEDAEDLASDDEIDDDEIGTDDEDADDEAGDDLDDDDLDDEDDLDDDDLDDELDDDVDVEAAAGLDEDDDADWHGERR